MNCALAAMQYPESHHSSHLLQASEAILQALLRCDQPSLSGFQCSGTAPHSIQLTAQLCCDLISPSTNYAGRCCYISASSNQPVCKATICCPSGSHLCTYHLLQTDALSI